MGSECRNRDQFQQKRNQRSKMFLPMLCSWPSVKEVKIQKWDGDDEEEEEGPLSPRVGCMGQVKRSNKSNNKMLVFPATNPKPILSHFNHKANGNSTVRYSKLRRLFSGGSLSAAASTSGRRQVVRSASSVSCRKDCGSISIVDLDPPLPVVKRVSKTGEAGETDSLWKRRSGGVALQSLQLQPFHHPGHQPHHPTTV